MGKTIALEGGTEMTRLQLARVLAAGGHRLLPVLPEDKSPKVEQGGGAENGRCFLQFLSDKGPEYKERRPEWLGAFLLF